MHGEIQALSAAEISDDLVTQKLSGSKYDMAGGADEGAAAHRTRSRKGNNNNNNNCYCNIIMMMIINFFIFYFFRTNFYLPNP